MPVVVVVRVRTNTKTPNKRNAFWKADEDINYPFQNIVLCCRAFTGLSAAFDKNKYPQYLYGHEMDMRVGNWRLRWCRDDNNERYRDVIYI